MAEETPSAPEKLKELVTRFADNLESYRSGKYNETQIRREFIDPFFKLLGWDVDNEQGYAEAYKDVIHEDAIKIGGATKAPDYCFRIGGTRKFFVEAKKPSVDIKGDPAPAYQLRRYAWSAKLPLSILTDFEELAVYDCRKKPDQSDAASTARILYMRFTDFEERWPEIAGIFARESILKGSFDKYAESTKKKRGTAEVDDAFLAEIEQWREELARNMAIRNPDLSQRDLNVAVQRTIDRTLFLRICEDRGIEEYGTLKEIAGKSGIYQRLFARFRYADDRYNSGLFHFTEEKGRPTPPDTLTASLAVDDKVLKSILNRLYYPESPYEFSVLPADILGQVYERFLGKVIRLTKGHQAKVEEKPEVRKAGGVYYTPTYIVDYIVKETVGKLVEGRTPQEVGAMTAQWRPSTAKGAHPVRVVDPACGSGSFLLGAYQFLLDWYRDRYVEDGPKKHATGKQPRLYHHPSGEWRLTTSERKRILLSHIYGVDIDAQAVEVTKLSLLLKVLEGESKEVIDAQLQLVSERALPDLDENIKCGNSLIGPDFYDSQQTDLFDEEEALRINAFDWNAEFPEAFKAGGFDAVIGNPPYVRIQTMKEFAPKTVEYYNMRYKSAGKGNYDIYVLFAERGLRLLKADCRLGYIVPHKFFNTQYGARLRGIITAGRHLSHIVHFGSQQVFSGVTTYTCMMFLNKTGSDYCDVVQVDDIDSWRSRHDARQEMIDASTFTQDEWNIVMGNGNHLFSRLAEGYPSLGEVAEAFVGVQTSADDVYIMSLIGTSGENLLLHSEALNKTVELERGLLLPLASGADVSRYGTLPSRQFILFPYKVTGSQVALLSFDLIQERLPLTANYLNQNRLRLENREKGRAKGPKWYGFLYLKNMARQSLPKVCVPRLVENLYGSVDVTGTHCLDNVDVGGVVWRHPHEAHGLGYLLGLLNSKLLRWFFPFVSGTFRGGWRSANKQFLSQLPIRTIDHSDPSEKARHERMVRLVDRMLDLHKRLAETKSDHTRKVIERDIKHTDAQIDKLVYELYGLTDEEIRIVEEATP